MGTYPEKGYRDVQRERPPFHAPSATPQDPRFQHFSVHNTHILTKNHKFFSIFPFKMPNFDKFSVPNPKNWPKFSSGSLNLGQKITSESSILS